MYKRQPPNQNDGGLVARLREHAEAPSPESRLLTSLGIADLAMEPFKASYAIVRGQRGGADYRLRYHWAFRVDEELVGLVYDSRSKPVSPGRIRSFIEFQAAGLVYSETREGLEVASQVTVLPQTQAFRFGAFVFYQFILGE